MQHYCVTERMDQLVTYGRTFLEPKEGVLYFNWSGSTVELVFRGTQLNAHFRADCGHEIEGVPGDPNAPTRATWPWVGVFLDDVSMPIRKFPISSCSETWLLHESAQPEIHRIRITKLTENSKTFLGITGFTAEGDFLPAQKQPRKRVEIVGDSITCGYGNLVKDPNRHFFSADEDNWLAYGPMAARKLGMEYSCVSISGITAIRHPGWRMDYAMCELYDYTDKVCQDKLGLEPQLWNFRENHNDYVVVNLGTNDCYAILFSPEEGELERFPDAYTAFLENIRRQNGPDTQIICTLGAMNYYLYHDIAEAVRCYRERTGDEKVHLLRLKPMHPFDGIGADGHPSLDTHKKMAQELADFIRSLENP